MLTPKDPPAVRRQELAGGVAWELITRGKGACGFLSYALAEGNSVKLSNIYIEKDSRGGPLVSAAIDRVVRYAAEQGRATVFLTVNKGNRRAVRAYEKCGFKITSSVVTDIGGGFVMDDYIMTRSLK
jgi:ribosomal protein S18 acetylase RimI-like enzyme